jgi:F-type H+-transporting ATPase subunit b
MLKRTWMLPAGLQLLLINIAVAAEEHGAAAGEHGESAPPSLFTGDFGNALWTLAIFFLLLVVLGKFAWKPLLTALQKREQFIRDSLEAARRDREEAQTALRKYEQSIAKAREEASAIVEEGRRDGESLKRGIEEEARRNADAMIDRAKREIASAKNTALRELYEQSAQLATTIAGNLLKREITPQDHRRLVEDALVEIGNGDGREGPESRLQSEV